MKIHFIGIGGIGVSALARYYLSRGNEITGSDFEPSEITLGLEQLGAEVSFGPNDEKVVTPELGKADLVVYSPAVQADNAELREAKELEIRCLSYPQALGELTRDHFTIAVSGTNGKSTTTALISLILIKAGLDPTVIIGTKLKEFGDSNYRSGKSKYLVIEADEYESSFLNYYPQAIVLTNIDRDHLDYFKTLGRIIKTFQRFVNLLPKDGIFVFNRADNNSLLIKKPDSKIASYSLKQRETKILKMILRVPGDHIVEDALAALTLARALKIPDRISLKALGEYRGAWRRFEIIKMSHPKPYTLVSDYAHNPTKVAVTLRAAREKYPRKKIWCIFQPHQYQRTYYLFKEFVEALGNSPVDKLILAPIYSVAGRESQEIKDKVSSEKLAEAITRSGISGIPQRGNPPVIQKSKKKEVIYLPKIESIANHLQSLRGGEVVIVMGAGDIYKLLKLLQNKLEITPNPKP